MMIKKPSRYFISSGHAEGFSKLNAFDQALLEAGVGDTNLVKLSSILPPHCKSVEPFPLPYGALVPVAYASITSSKKGQVIAAAVAVGIPLDPELPGLIMEHHDEMPLKDVEHQVREMVIQGMAYRNREIKDIRICGAEHVVEKHGSAFAGVVLWDETSRD